MAPIFDNLLYALDATTGILTLTVNRPTKLNALNAATITELGKPLRTLAKMQMYAAFC
jgi:enoyl-CoA hydratase